MSSSGAKPPSKLLALGKRVTSSCWTDGGGLRGLSELLIIKEIMHRPTSKENVKRKSEGQPPLTSLLKPCYYFYFIGGTSTRGELLLYPIFMILKLCVYSYRILALMPGHRRMGIDTAIDAYNI